MTAVVEVLVTVAKDNLRVSAPAFVLLAFGVGILMLYSRRLAAIGRRWLVIVAIAYWFMATPGGAWLLAWPLARGYRPIDGVEQVRGARTLVVLGGGIASYLDRDHATDDLQASAPRVLEALRLYHLLGDMTIIVSGGNTGRLQPPRTEAAAFRDRLVSLGVPASRIEVESRSMTTREEAVILRPRLAAEPGGRFVLVTSPTHMRRSLATFRAVGLDPIPAVAPLRSHPNKGLYTIVPDRESLMIADQGLYDTVAFGYYWLRGWLPAAPTS